jgi:hypothetical protein
LIYSPSYKRFIASVLLALYSFICLPASAWHSHNKIQTGAANTANKAKEKQTLAVTNGNSEGICKICAHHYQLHRNDADLPSICALIFSFIDKPYQNRFHPESPVFLFLNKGPPAFS